ncbi:MAG: hypothetical protein NT062_33015 [Proteobacteria bacterium]|nr:hypothetical protein [Pseudomonadota bacterium]
MKNLSRISWLVAVVLGACGGGKGEAKEPVSTRGTDCGAVATKLVDMMGKHAGLTDDASRSKAHSALAGTCETGDWSEEVKRCFVTATDETATAACGDKLDEAQKKDMVQSIGG